MSVRLLPGPSILQWCSEPGVDYFVVAGGARDLTGVVDTTILAINDDFTSLYEVKDGACSCVPFCLMPWLLTLND